MLFFLSGFSFRIGEVTACELTGMIEERGERTESLDQCWLEGWDLVDKWRGLPGQVGQFSLVPRGKGRLGTISGGGRMGGGSWWEFSSESFIQRHILRQTVPGAGTEGLHFLSGLGAGHQLSERTGEEEVKTTQQVCSGPGGE